MITPFTLYPPVYSPLVISLRGHDPACWYSIPNLAKPGSRWYLKPESQTSLVSRGRLDSRGRRLRPGTHSASSWIVFGCNCSCCFAEVAVRVDGFQTEIDKRFGARK